jgi:hypothetical protein
MTLFVGISTGLCGYGAYTCLQNFIREKERSKQQQNELNANIIDFENRSTLTGSGIVKIQLQSPVDYYVVYKLKKSKDIELVRYSGHNIFTGKKFEIIAPAEVKKFSTTFIDNFLASTVFTNTCVPSLNASYMFKTKNSILHCDGKFLTDLLNDKHGMKVMYGGNRDIFELKTTTLNSNLFMYGENINNNKFCYDIVTDNKDDLINKIVSENNSCIEYFFGTFICTSGFLFGLACLIANKN